MQFVENEKAQALCGADQIPALCWPGEQVFEHHVVREQDVRLAGEDAGTLFLVFLAGVALEGDLSAPPGQPPMQVTGELLQLAVGQRVHRVDDDRLDPTGRRIAQDRVDDRHHVGEALARAGSGGEHIATAIASGLDGFPLVLVEGDRPRAGVVLVRLGTEELLAGRVEHALRDQLGDGAATGEARVEGDPRIWPAHPCFPLVSQVRGDTRVTNAHQ